MSHRPASLPLQVLPHLTASISGLSFPFKAARPVIGQLCAENMADPFLSREFTLTQGYYLSFEGNGVDRVTDITNQG